MKRLLPILIVLLALLAYGQRDEKVPAQQSQKASVASVLTKQEQQHQEATLTDATNLYRICSTRVQRIVPSHGAKSERFAGQSSFARRRIVKPLYHLHDSRRRLETAPFCLAASCSYYVIALRHIIR